MHEFPNGILSRLARVVNPKLQDDQKWVIERTVYEAKSFSNCGMRLEKSGNKWLQNSVNG